MLNSFLFLQITSRWTYPLRWWAVCPLRKKIMFMHYLYIFTCLCVSQSDHLKSMNVIKWLLGSVQKKIQSLPGLCRYSLTYKKPSKLKSLKLKSLKINLPTLARLIFLNAIFIMTFLSSPSIQSNPNLKRLILRFIFFMFKTPVHF